MIIGVPREIKDNEYRVAATPGGVELLTGTGHKVLVEAGAGVGSGFTDEEYVRAGAVLVEHEDAFREADLVLKVKEPLPSEYGLLREGLVLFTYLHLAAEPALTKAMVERQVTGIAYETVEMPDRTLPLLIPMSEVAGRMSIQVAAHYLEEPHGGRGKLLGGVPGVRPSDVVIVGAGTVGTNAAKIALGMGAHVTLIDRDLFRLRYLDEVLHGNLTTLSSNPRNIADAVSTSDVVIGSVLIPGAKAPKLVTKEMVASMKPGSVVIDVAVDQGGCIETSRVTSHTNPTYQVNGVVHYAVPNMPGAVPRTSTYALSNATLPYVVRLAKLGFKEAVRQMPELAKGVNTYRGKITHQAVADAFGYEYVPFAKLL
ncbi:MAG: alanine dehydrogenase [Sphingomonadaceae bacterium]